MVDHLQILCGPVLAESTLGIKLSAIEGLYVHAAERSGHDLDLLIARADVAALQEVMGGFFLVLTNRSNVTGKNTSQSWSGAVDFIRFLMRRLTTESAGICEDLERSFFEHEMLLSHLLPSRARMRPARLRALPACVVNELLQIAHPESASNPFRDEATRWRNYVLLLLLLFEGLRRGEAVLLTPHSVKDGVDLTTGKKYHWVNVQVSEGLEDPRYERPGIKTALSSRQIPLDQELVAVIDHYVDVHRLRQEHGFLFASNRGRPLSIRMVGYIFEALSERLSETARARLQDRCSTTSVTAHDLRHTCAVARLGLLRDNGADHEESLQLLRSFFGWSKNSVMPSHYAEAHFEDRLKTVFETKLDSRTEFIRKLRQLDEHSSVYIDDGNKGGN